jgi:hypothetical protein
MTGIGSGHFSQFARAAVWTLIFALVAARFARAGQIGPAIAVMLAGAVVGLIPVLLARRFHRIVPQPMSGPARVFAITMDLGGLLAAVFLLNRVVRL